MPFGFFRIDSAVPSDGSDCATHQHEASHGIV